MPTGTFFRLPDEKRKRLTDAAWKEFTRTRFSETSISRIIQTAGIPRGSFYQYFADKEDLLRYLFSDIRDYFIRMFILALQEAQGDLFEMPFRVFRMIVQDNGTIDPGVRKCMELLQVNPGLDIESAIFRKYEGGLDLSQLRKHIDVSLLRNQEEGFVEHAFALTVKLTASLTAEVLSGTMDRDMATEHMHIDLDILKYGCVKAAADSVEDRK